MNRAACSIPAVFLVWRNTLEASLRNIKDLFVKKIKKIVKIFHICIFLFEKIVWFFKARIMSYISGNRKKIIELSALQSFILCHSQSNDQPGLLFSISCVIINHYSIRSSIT